MSQRNRKIGNEEHIICFWKVYGLSQIHQGTNLYTNIHYKLCYWIITKQIYQHKMIFKGWDIKLLKRQKEKVKVIFHCWHCYRCPIFLHFAPLYPALAFNTLLSVSTGYEYAYWLIFSPSFIQFHWLPSSLRSVRPFHVSMPLVLLCRFIFFIGFHI